MIEQAELGDQVVETVTGFKGIVVGVTKWLHGCDRLVVQPPVDKDNKVPEAQSFDAMAIKVVKKAVKPKDERTTKTGGPQPYKGKL